MCVNYYAKSRQVGECIEWIGAKDRNGYGRTSYLGRKGITVHRAVWLQAGRDIAEEYELDHICRNRACIRLEHLRAVTHKVNCNNRSTTTNELCSRGHPRRPMKSGKLYCPKCVAAAVKRHRAKSKPKPRGWFWRGKRRPYERST